MMPRCRQRFSEMSPNLRQVLESGARVEATLDARRFKGRLTMKGICEKFAAGFALQATIEPNSIGPMVP